MGIFGEGFARGHNLYRCTQLCSDMNIGSPLPMQILTGLHLIATGDAGRRLVTQSFRYVKLFTNCPDGDQIHKKNAIYLSPVRRNDPLQNA